MASKYIVLAMAGCVALLCCAGCSPKQYHAQADKAAYGIVKEGQKAAGKNEPFNIERPSDILRRRLLKEQNLPVADKASFGRDALDPIKFWPEPKEPNTTGSSDVRIAAHGGEAVKLTLMDALEVGARNSFAYQDEKERVFSAAIALDVARHDFGSQFTSQLSGTVTNDTTSGKTVNSAEYGDTVGWSKRLENGAQLTSNFTVGVVNLLTADHASSMGLQADASISIPLLRGAGVHIAREPLTQAERDVLYAVWRFEKYKQQFAVDVASNYLDVLRRQDEITNAEQNYKGLITSTRRIKRQAEAGIVPQIQVDQAVQNELSARNRWVNAQQNYSAGLDGFKLVLGLPTDANVVLDREELSRLTKETSGVIIQPEAVTDVNAPVLAADAPAELLPAGASRAGAFEIDPERAIKIAFRNRNDLLSAIGQVYDGQRGVIVAADQLNAELTLLGRANLGNGRSVGSDAPDEHLRIDRAQYNALLTLDLPIDRQVERDNYRLSIVNLEQNIRAQQSLEDQIKQQVRNKLRDLLGSRESVQIQAQAVKLAEKRVKSTDLFLQAGRAQVRDLLDAQESLLSAQNSLTTAIVGYRVAELELQRDMGVLTVDEKGLWKEFRPGEYNATEQ